MAAFSSDNQHITTTSFDNTAKLWNANNGQLRQILAGHTDTVLEHDWRKLTPEQRQELQYQLVKLLGQLQDVQDDDEEPATCSSTSSRKAGSIFGCFFHYDAVRLLSI